MFLALLQGASELFPVSSLGHTVLVPALLHWNVDRKEPTFLAFVVVLHLGTAIALVVFYRRDWARIVRALARSVARGRLGDDPDERLGWLLVAGTIPVGILGVFFEEPIRSLFGSSLLVSVFLIANAGVMFAGESLKRRVRAHGGVAPLARLSYADGAKIGLSQALALLPGISRSGVSIVSGLVLDLDHTDAARFSFLLATPVIAAASVLEVPRILVPEAHGVLVEALVGGAISGLTAYASVAFLTRWFHSNDLRPFGWYCLAIGTLGLVLALTKVIT